MKTGTRVALNAAITYGRYLLGLVFGLFSSRWILAALGQTDLGLYGVVTSIVASVSFFNVVLTDSAVRFYAVSIGAGDERRFGECFFASLAIHAVLAALVLSAGWLGGGFALRHWLNIPPERMSACLFSLRAAVAASAVCVAAVPCHAMFTARQRFGEPALYALAGSALTCLAAFVMLRSGDDRLMLFAASIAAVTAGIAAVSALRALWRWGASCREVPRGAVVAERVREILSYASWRCVQAFGGMAQLHFSAFVVNRFFGAGANAAYSVSRQFATHAYSLSYALSGAVTPAIASEAGGGDVARTARMALTACRFMSVLAAMVGIPLLCEAENVLDLWLSSPPAGASTLAAFFAAVMMADSVTSGLSAALAAQTRIGAWQTLSCAVAALSCGGAWACFRAGLPLASLGAVLVASAVAAGAVNVLFARRLVGIGAIEWARKVLLPFAAVAALAVPVAFGVRSAMQPGFLRLVAVGCASASVVLMAGWFMVFTADERRLAAAVARGRRG